MDINAIRTVLHAQPFRPFSFRLADGRELYVPHPDFVALSPRQVIVIHPDESHTILEPLLIVSIERKADGKPAEKPQQQS
jgi:hypothetical protein